MPRLDLARQNAGARLLLRVEADRLARERHHRRRHAALLDDGPLFRQIAPEHGQSAVLRIGILQGADDVVVRNPGRVDLLADRLPADGGRVRLDQFARQALQNRHDPAGAVQVHDVVVARRRQLADVGRARRNLVHARQGVVDPRLAGYGERVEHRVRRAAHRHVERDGVIHGSLGNQILRERTARLRQRHGAERRLAPKFLPPRVYRQNGPVPRQRQAERLAQAVHGVGREHARTRTAPRAARLLHRLKVLFRYLAHVFRPDGLEDGIQVRILPRLGVVSRGHGAARSEDGRDARADGADDHARHDLVAVRHADHRVETVRPRHRLDRIGDQFARGKRKLHARVRHGDAVAHGDRVELHRHAARLDDALLQPLADLVQVAVPRHETLVAVANADKRLVHVRTGHAGREQKTAMGGAFLPLLYLI